MSKEERRIRVLVIDDDLDLARARADFLEELGCDVTAVSTAAEATRLLSSSEPIDLVMTDINLAGNAYDQSGLALARLSKEMRPATPVVAYSSYFKEAHLKFEQYPEVNRWFVKGSLGAAQMEGAMGEVVALARAMRSLPGE